MGQRLAIRIVLVGQNVGNAQLVTRSVAAQFGGGPVRLGCWVAALFLHVIPAESRGQLDGSGLEGEPLIRLRHLLSSAEGRRALVGTVRFQQG
jgi:hypothetical protein